MKPPNSSEDGKPTAGTEAARKPIDRETRRRILDEVREAARGKATPGPDAARSQDFLYGDDGMPG